MGTRFAWEAAIEESKMPIAPGVIDRLLVAKGLLGPIRFLPVAHPDRITLARHVLDAHDAAELALAAIAGHLNRLPKGTQAYLMDYFPAIEQDHPGQSAPGRDYFSQLNRVRTNIKHHGIFPDPQQWYSVGKRTWEYISSWCQDYLGRSLDDLDESALIAHSDVKRHYDAAVEEFRQGSYKGALERLALASQALLESNEALRNIYVGIPRAEDAIKLAAFGVHANDFLTLQEFLPRFTYDVNHNRLIKWEQEEYGHPANWNHQAVEFSLKTFVEVALRIQDADLIPGAIAFVLVYEHKITALVDGVEIVQEQSRNPLESRRVAVRVLRKGEFLRGKVSPDATIPAFQGSKPRSLLFVAYAEDFLWGEVEAEKVRITCVPNDNPWVLKHFPDLPELDYDP